MPVPGGRPSWMCVTLGNEFEVAGDKYRIVEILDEPNTGLCVVRDLGRTWNFTVPVTWVAKMLPTGVRSREGE